MNTVIDFRRKSGMQPASLAPKHLSRMEALVEDARVGLMALSREQFEAELAVVTEDLLASPSNFAAHLLLEVYDVVRTARGWDEVS